VFSTHPPALRKGGGRTVCLVAAAPGGLNGTKCLDWLTAAAADLETKGWRVRILWCGGQPPPGADLLSLDQVPVDATLSLPNLYGACPSDQSDRVRAALEKIHQQSALDLVIFPTRGGLGFRAIQGKRAGQGLAGVTLAVCLDGCSAWFREQQGRWPSGLADLELDYIERYAFEHADEHLGCSSVLGDYVRANGWSMTNTPAWSQEPSAPTSPLVTICVPHYNLGQYLPQTLASIAAQGYPHLEVLVIDDGSTDPASRQVFQDMQQRYPAFHFLTQPNSGIGATRNRGLCAARGEYFIPVDADNVLSGHLVERLVAGIQRRPELGALTCYFLAFEQEGDLERGNYLHACRPTGGPLFLASLRNVYGDALAIYRTTHFRAVGGYGTDRDTSFEDWEAFVKLVRGGYAVDVLPEYLFYYRHRSAGFSRTTRDHANRERVLRQFRSLGLADLPPAEASALWHALAGFQQRLAERDSCLRYRIADRLHAAGKRIPGVMRAVKWVFQAAGA
jgi:glycosyltransferase involved in cell wall biosynthesis